jgi:hypothetical protein
VESIADKWINRVIKGHTVKIMYRFAVSVLCCLGFAVTGCGGNSTSSGGPTPFAGTYNGSVTVAGIGSSTLTIVIAVNGEITFEVSGGGIVCGGDVPEGLELDGDSFDASDSGECLIGGFPCPTTTVITGAISGGTITGSGQVLVGCPASFQPFDFRFVAS